MSTTEENREIIEEVFEAAGRGDMTVLASYLADDVELLQAAGHPVGRTSWKGPQEVMAGVGEVFALLRPTGFEIKEVVADGPFRVIGLLDLVVEHLGEKAVLPYAEIFRVEDGRITEIRAMYFDLVEVNKLVGSYA